MSYTPVQGVVSPGLGFVEIARKELDSVADVLEVNIPIKNYLQILASLLSDGSGSINALLTFNGDIGAKYSNSRSLNFAAEAATINQNSIFIGASPVNADIQIFGKVQNFANTRSIYQGKAGTASATGAGTKPINALNFGKWSNLANQINKITITNGLAGSYDIGSKLIVLGRD